MKFNIPSKGKKRNLLFLLILLTGFNAFADRNRHHRYKPEPMVLNDRTIQFQWNINTQEWELNNVLYYGYKYINSDLKEKAAFSSTYCTPVSRIYFDYVKEGYTQYYQNWLNDQFLTYRKRIVTYDDHYRLGEEIHINWSETDQEWVNQKRNYLFNWSENGFLQTYIKQTWDGFRWNDYSLHTYTYNYLGLVAEVKETYIDTGIDKLRNVHFYDDQGHRTERIIQYWRTNRWDDYVRYLYTTDEEGYTTSMVYQVYGDEGWKNVSMNEYTYKTYRKNRDFHLPVCHKNRILYLPLQVVYAHMKHGDCIGPCEGIDAPYSYINDKEVSNHHYLKVAEHTGGLRIYPNPVETDFTIHLGQNLNNTFKIEILDISGKILRSLMTEKNVEFIIPRENLEKGIYFIRFYGDEIVTEKVILQ